MGSEEDAPPAHPHCRPKKGKLKVPTLLMWAEDDGAFTPKVFEDTEAHVEDLTTIGLSDCSHWAQQDRCVTDSVEGSAAVGG